MTGEGAIRRSYYFYTVSELGNGTIRYQVYARSRVRDQRSMVYAGTFGTRREAEAADETHRVTQRRIKSGERPPAVDDRRTSATRWMRGSARSKEQRSHDEYESRMRLYVRPTFDRTPLVKITKPKLIDLRTSLKEREEPIGNATINTLFASLQAAFNYFIEQGWCAENPLELIDDLHVAERPFLWRRRGDERGPTQPARRALLR